MSFTQFERKRIEALTDEFIESRRPPAELRDKIDLGFRLEKQSVIIFEIRPVWNDPSKVIEPMVAKATYVKRQNAWKIYWQRADMKWHSYDPLPEVEHFEEFLEAVGADDYCCFWG
ncbi:MAG: DUF3024 domain-containing protein [Phycisphaerae bacterium]|nr:DUF3024 domain-containing protein [Phycisphaerae bacterium]